LYAAYKISLRRVGLVSKNYEIEQALAKMEAEIINRPHADTYFQQFKEENEEKMETTTTTTTSESRQEEEEEEEKSSQQKNGQDDSFPPS